MAGNRHSAPQRSAQVSGDLCGVGRPAHSREGSGDPRTATGARRRSPDLAADLLGDLPVGICAGSGDPRTAGRSAGICAGSGDPRTAGRSAGICAGSGDPRTAGRGRETRTATGAGAGLLTSPRICWETYRSGFVRGRETRAQQGGQRGFVRGRETHAQQGGVGETRHGHRRGQVS